MESGVRAEQASGIVPSLTSPQQTMQQRGLLYPGKYLRLCSLQHNRYTETEKYGPNERTDQDTRKRAKHEEIDNLSDAGFKTLVIRIFTELIELGQKMK